MVKLSAEKSYKWDIAISLCKQDIEFAKNLIKTINPALKTFFYEDRQEELISKSGPVAFAKTFKEESRVVVILSRSEWSNSFYTDIERNAIIDRTAVKNEGYQFIVVISMVQGEIPPWYPSTQIYASPFRFTIEELAHFIEFKIAEEGGIIKTLTVEDRYQNLIDKIAVKRSIINLQHNEVAIQSAPDEITNLKNCFNNKSEFLRKSIVDKVFFEEFNIFFNRSRFGYGDYLLECQFSLPNGMFQVATTQDIWVTFELFKIFETERKSLEIEQRIFYYTHELQGWALPHLYEPSTKMELQVLFRNRDNTEFYDLINPLRTDTLVDKWFQQLLSKSTEAIERYV